VEKRRWLHHRLLGGGVRAVTGIASALALVVLLATAIGLQYAPEEAHAALSWVHWLLGVAMAAAIVVHRLVRNRRPARG